MEKDIVYYAKKRYSTKVFDKSKKISEENISKVKDLLRYAASSINSQPWNFIIASSDEAKAKVAKACEKYPFNLNAVLDASHVVVFASKTDLSEEYFLKLLEQEDKDGRYLKPEFKDRVHEVRYSFVDIHNNELKDTNHWVDKQLYLNLGSFLLGVAALEIDALPMEGVDFAVLDEQFDLREKGYRSVVVVPIGYADKEADFNAKLPKSRLPLSEIITEE